MTPKVEYEGGGGSNDPLYFIHGPAGSAVWYGQMVSYDGATVKAGGDENGNTPKSISFTAAIASDKLTISGLTGDLATLQLLMGRTQSKNSNH